MKAILHKGMEAFAARALTSKKFKNRCGEVVVLMYHGVVEVEPDLPDWCLLTKDVFEGQIKYLKDNFNVISLKDAVNGLRNDSIKGPTAVITFDDGYQNNYDTAFPILKKYQVPATIYVTSKFIDTGETIWTGMLQDAFSRTKLKTLSWQGSKLDLSTRVLKKVSVERVKSALKQEPLSVIEAETRNLLDKLCEGENLKIAQTSPYRMLSSSMIEEMAKSELIEFGAHTHNHPILSKLTKLEQQEEIEKSIELISNASNTKCGTFAYPNGRVVDYTKETVSILEGADMYVSLSTTLGVCRKDTPLMEYRRFGVGDDTDFKRGLYNMYAKN